MLLLFWNGAQTSPPSLLIVTGNPIGLLLALTYTCAAVIVPNFVTPACRTATIEFENRTFAIPHEDRTATIECENRTLEVTCH